MACYRKRFIVLLRGCAVLSLMVSTNGWSMTASPSWSLDGNYTVSWPYEPTGCEYTYIYPYYMVECYWLEERVDGGNWVPVSTGDNVMSWNATGKPDGTYEYRLVYSYDDCCSGGGYQYVFDGPVTVEVGVPPLPLSEEHEYSSRHGDLDGDGDIDLYVKRIAGTSWQLPIAELVLRQNSNGTFNVETTVSQATRNIVNGWGISLTAPRLADFNADGYMDLLIKGLSPASVGPHDLIVFAANGPGAPPPSSRLLDESIQEFFTDIVGYLADPSYFSGAYQISCYLSWSTIPDWRWDIDYSQYWYYFPAPTLNCIEEFNPAYSYTASVVAASIKQILDTGQFIEGTYAANTVTSQLGSLYGTQFVATAPIPSAQDILDMGRVGTEWGTFVLGSRRASRVAATILHFFIENPRESTAAGPHEYTVGTNICSTSTPGCTIEAVFEEVRKFPAPGHAAPEPGQPDPCAGEPRSSCDVPVQTGDFTRIEVYEWSNSQDDMGTVRHTVDPVNHRLTNSTEPDHFFHEGVVVRSVVIENGYVRINTVGTGTGDYPNLNEIGGELVFKGVDIEIMARIGDAIGAPAP